MIGKQEVIKKLRREHEQMRKVIAGLSEEELTQIPVFKDSGWTVKDIITHVSAWHLGRQNQSLLQFSIS